MTPNTDVPGWIIRRVTGKSVDLNIAELFLQPGNPETFTRFYPDDNWYGDVAYAYHDQWWTFNNSHKAVSAIGVHGQYVYLDAKTGMVVVKQTSSPDAEGGANLSSDTDGRCSTRRWPST